MESSQTKQLGPHFKYHNFGGHGLKSLGTLDLQYHSFAKEKKRTQLTAQEWSEMNKMDETDSTWNILKDIGHQATEVTAESPQRGRVGLHDYRKNANLDFSP